MSLSDVTRARLEVTATATLAAALQRRGIPNTFFTELRPTRTGRKMIGLAKTLRYVPMREDLVPTLSGGLNAQRRAVETIAPGEVLVIEARNQTGAGTIGDIFAQRCFMRGATGVVTDGCLRDSGAVSALEIPAYYRAAHAATLARVHLPLDIDLPIACAGVLVMPGDVIVGDDDGAMVIPIALVDEVAEEAHEQELKDMWSFERVSAGDSTNGVFPVSKERLPEYQAWKAARES